MGYQPRTRSPKGAIHGYERSDHKKGKNKKHIRRRIGRSIREEKHITTEKEVTELTLKQLHTLGSQRFGSFPFSEHFNRWLTNVTSVLSEFESYPDISVDDQFLKERAETLSTIKLQLERRRSEEASVNQEMTDLSNHKKRLEQVNAEYLTKIRAIRDRKKGEIKRLYSSINRLKKDQDRVIRMKTGLFQGVSRRSREQKEVEIAQELNDKQRELELAILDLNVAKKDLRDEYELKKEPVFERIKYFQKRIENLEADGSLEERWFACESLTDAVNAFLQRKVSQARTSPKTDKAGT